MNRLCSRSTTLEIDPVASQLVAFASIRVTIVSEPPPWDFSSIGLQWQRSTRQLTTSGMKEERRDIGIDDK